VRKSFRRHPLVTHLWIYDRLEDSTAGMAVWLTFGSLFLSRHVDADDSLAPASSRRTCECSCDWAFAHTNRDVLL